MFNEPTEGIINDWNIQNDHAETADTIDPELRHRFKYHKVDDSKKSIMEEIRESALLLADLIDNVTSPDSREKTIAIYKLEEAVFWANAAIARDK